MTKPTDGELSMFKRIMALASQSMGKSAPYVG